MKKMLLFMAAFFSAATSFAQFSMFMDDPDWTKTLVDVVENPADAYVNAPIVITNQGDVVKTGVFTQAFSFAGETLEPIAKSAYILKYDKNGNEVWGVALQGAATVTAITTDDEGNIYAAGRFADKVVVGSADGNTVEIEGMEDNTEQVSAFIVAYDAAGNLLNQKTVIPSYDMELFMTALMNDGFYLADSKFDINKIVVANEKVYFTANYMGNNTLDDVVLEGKILDMFGMQSFCLDLNNFALIQLDKDLGNAKLLADVYTSAEAVYGDMQMGPQAMKFAVDGDNVYAAWTGWGDISMTMGEETKDFSFEVGSESAEHGYVVANVTTGQTAVFNAPLEESEALFYTISGMEAENGVLYLGGTFIGGLAFDNTKTSTGACDAYIAALNTEDFSVVWAENSGIDEGEFNKYNEMGIPGLFVQDGVASMVVNTIDMSTKQIEQCNAFAYVPVMGMGVTVNVPFTITAGATGAAGTVVNCNQGPASTLIYFADKEFVQGIETLENNALNAENGAVYNLQGQRMTKTQKGVFIQNGKKVVMK